MKLRFIIAFTILLTTLQISAVKSQTLTDTEQLSYSFGYTIGNNFKQQGIEIDANKLIKGIQDALSASTPLLNQAERKAILDAFKKQMMAKQLEARNALASRNLEEGKAFLAKNATEEGVITLESGLQYKVIKSGEGEMPNATDNVTTDYQGTLLDGTVFDSSYKRGKTASFPVNGVIAGWREALQLMREGDKWQLFIPSKLAYGERGTPTGSIGPNATLIFDIELISINKDKDKE
jgi:FKBP-type peptidyl-prolyl cis-trans isomerase